jgi:hypothetical protein
MAEFLAVSYAISAAMLWAQDPFPPVPPGGYAVPPGGYPNGGYPTSGQPTNGLYPGSGQQSAMPYQPLSPVRPNDFPGGPVPPMVPNGGVNGVTYISGQQANAGGFVPANYAGPRQPPAVAPAPAQLCAGTLILARIGDDVVLTSDLPVVVEEMVSKVDRNKVPREKIVEQRAALMKELSESVEELAAHNADPDPAKGLSAAHRGFLNMLVHRMVEIKLLYQDFRKTVPKEALAGVEETVAKRFEEFQLKLLFERENVTNRADLETSLRAKGSSLDREKRIFKEQFLSQTWLQQQVLGDKKEGEDAEVTHEEMLKWYQEHIKKFESEPQVRWEELMITFTRHADHKEAYAAMAALGNRVLAGAALADVARTASDGPTARSGGTWDWTHRGTLNSQVLEDAIFDPQRAVGTLSEIIETPDGFHIIRVIDRQGLLRKPFLQVQKEIKESIKNERLQAKFKEFVDKIRAKYPVWTVFDNSMQPANPEEAPEEDRYSRR